MSENFDEKPAHGVGHEPALTEHLRERGGDETTYDEHARDAAASLPPLNPSGQFDREQPVDREQPAKSHRNEGGFVPPFPASRSHLTTVRVCPQSTLKPRTNTSLDALNPVTRLLIAAILSIPLLLTLDWLSASIVLGSTVIAALLVGFQQWRHWRRTLPIVVAAPFAGISMLLYADPGGRVYWSWSLITISDRSIELALAVALRMLAIGISSLVLLAGVDATRMADGLAQIVRMPARLVLGTLAGFRLLETFAEDWRKLTMARRTRGLTHGNQVQRLISMYFALLVLAIRRGSRVALAMEARGITSNTGTRTWARVSSLSWRDWIAIALAIVIISAALGVATMFGTFWFVGS